MNGKSKSIAMGSKVKLHFSIALEDGMIAESSFGQEPVELVIGTGELHQGLEQVLYGLGRGDKGRFKLSPEQSFGFRDPQAVHALARSEFPQEIPLEPGVIVEFTTPGGDQIPGIVLDMAEDRVRVDFNHPLAGHELTYIVEILEVSNP